MTESITQRMQKISYSTDLYADIPSLNAENHVTGAMSGKITITSAPEVESPSSKPAPNTIENNVKTVGQPTAVDLPKESTEPRKKKYAKEAWPGKKPGPNLFSV